MKTSTIRGSLLGLICLLSSPAWAISISLEPSSQIGMPGDTVFLDLTISGLGNLSAPSLGAFDIELIFDDAALNFIGGTFGDGLNDPLDPFTVFIQSITAGVGLIDLAEVSLFDPAPLDARQADTFILATLEFFVDVLPPGSFTEVDFGAFLLGDGFGIELLNVDSEGAIIRNPSGMPEPQILLLLGIGVFGFAVARRFR